MGASQQNDKSTNEKGTSTDQSSYRGNMHDIHTYSGNRFDTWTNNASECQGLYWYGG
jgi:hypothetical protein